MTDEEARQIWSDVNRTCPASRAIEAFAHEIVQRTLLAADDICEISEREFDKAGESGKAYGAWICKTRIRALMEKK